MKISIYRYNFPGIISDGRCHPYAGNVILLRFLFRACAYLPPAAQTRLRLRQWALMVAACLHVITKASQTFNVLAPRNSLPECTKHQPSIIQFINIRKFLSRMSFIFFTLNCHGCPTGSRSARITGHWRQWHQPLLQNKVR